MYVVDDIIWEWKWHEGVEFLHSQKTKASNVVQKIHNKRSSHTISKYAFVIGFSELEYRFKHVIEELKWLILKAVNLSFFDPWINLDNVFNKFFLFV